MYYKYEIEKQQVSYDSGITWTDTYATRRSSNYIDSYDTLSECEGEEPPTPPTPSDYLTIESLDNNNKIYFFKVSGGGKSISASTDNGTTWTRFSSTNIGSGTTIATLDTGEKVLLKGDNSKYNGLRFTSSGEYKLSGNIMSLIYGDSFTDKNTLTETYTFSNLFSQSTGLKTAENLILPATTLANFSYRGMFSGCTSLTTAPTLLPATTLTNQCYYEMFRGCSSLTTVPELPATTLAEGCYCGMFRDCTSLTTAPVLSATTMVTMCYRDMFRGCSSLTAAPVLPATIMVNNCYERMFHSCSSLATAPALPATTMANNCYEHMFNSCTSLTTAPTLPATTLTNYCYRYMFYGCTSLNYIKCLATDISASQSTLDWVISLPSTGTFVKAASMNDWTTGNSGIPNNWTVQNA